MNTFIFERSDTFRTRKTKRWFALLSFCFMLFMGQTGFAQTVEIGTGVSTNTNIPVYTYYGYNVSQQIVTASELGNPGTKQITKIRWYVDGNANLMSSSDNWQVYLGNTTKTDFTSNTDWVLAGDMTQVFSGTVTAVNASWMEITLSSTFVYTGDNLVVAVNEVEPSYAGSYSSNTTFGSYTSATNTGIYIRKDSAPYNLTNSPGSGTRTSILARLQIELSEPPSCLPPSALTATNLTYSSADLGWTSDGNAFEIKWGAPGFDVETEGTLVEDFVSGATLSGLDAETTYEFYVRQNCEEDVSPWAGPYSFYTGYCVPTGTSSSYRILGVATSGGYTNISNLNNGTTNPYNNYSYMSVSQSPGEQINYTVNVPAYSGGLRIWVDLNQNLIFEENELVATHTTYNVTSLTGVINIPEELPLGEYRVRIRSNYSSYTIPACGNAEYGYGEAEDYTLSVVAPPSCFPPTALTATNLTSNSADLGWTSDGNAFEIKWGMSGFDVETEGTLVEDFENEGTLSGLESQTAYQFYVRNNCGVDGLSAWAGPFGFTTLCAPLIPPTTIQDFSGYTGVAPTTLSCWSEATGTLDNLLTGTTSTWSNQTYNTNINSSHPNGTAAYINLYGTDNEWLITPAVDLGDGSTAYQMEYDVSITPWTGVGPLTDMGEKFVKVVISTDGGETWLSSNVLRTYDNSNIPAGGHEDILPLAGYTGIVKFAFYAHSTSTAIDTRFYIDNWKVVLVPSCPKPTALTATNLTTNSADLGWTSDGDQFDIKWGTSGFDVETEGTLVEDFLSGGTLSGLESQTAYQFYVRNNCGVDGLSVWAGPFSFTTLCAPFDVLDENFDSYGTGNIVPECWTRLAPTTSVGSQTITTTTPASGTRNIYQYSGTASNPVIVVLPSFSNISEGTHWLRFKARVGSGAPGALQVGYVTDATDYDSFVLIETLSITNTSYATDAEYTVAVPTTVPAGARLAIKNAADAKSYYWDDVIWEEAPSCLPPSALTATNLTTNSADLGWTSGGEQFEIKWGMSGFDVETEGTLEEDFVSGATLSGLAPQTAYQFYVRNNCGIDGLSIWAGPFSFTTLLANDNIENAIPVSCGETYTGSTATATNDQPNPAVFGVAATLSPNVWYSYTGSGEPELITASLCNSGFDTAILIATGTPGDLTWVAGNEDFCGTSNFRSQVEFASDGTTTYYIMVRGYGAASTGTYELVITCQEACSPATTNDEVADAEIVILGTPLATNNTCATASPQSYPTCGSQYATYYDSWYTFNSGNSGNVNVIITPEVDVTVGFAVYSGTPESLIQVVCTTIGASTNFNVIQNTDYYVRAFSTTPSAKGEFILSVSSNCTAGEWIGGTSTAWNTASNWCGGVVPDSTTDVVINSANPAVISTDITVNSITLGADASLTVASNTSLTTGDITVAAGGSFVIENNANLFQTAGAVNTGDVAVKRNSSLIKHLDYTLWSSPVAEQGLKAFSPQTIWYRIYTYNTTTDQWAQVFGNSEAPDTDFEAGTGYMFRAPNNFATTPYTYNGEFTGAPHNGNVTVNFNATNGTYQGIGNPYPSNIRIEGADGFWDANPGTGALYFWTNTNAWDDSQGDYVANNWAMYNGVGGTMAANDSKIPNGIIPVGQGFVVESNALNSVTFTNDMRTSDAGVFFKMLDQDKGRLWLDLSEDSQVLNQILVGYVSGASQGYDFGYDSEMFGYTGSALYSLIGNDGVDYAIQGRALPFDDNDEVPLGFRANSGGSFTISLSNFDGLFIDENQDIFLKDNLTGEEHNLKNDAYSFVSEEGTFNSRFSIVYKEAGSLNVSTPDLNNNWVVFKQNDMFHIQTQGIDMSEVTVYDVLGRVVYTSEAEGSNHTISRIEANQVLIVKVTTSDNQVLTKKVNN